MAIFMCKSLYSICVTALLLYNVQIVQGTHQWELLLSHCIQYARISLYLCVWLKQRANVDLRFIHCCSLHRVHSGHTDDSLSPIWYHLLWQNSKLFCLTKQAENGAVSKLNNHSDLHTLKTPYTERERDREREWVEHPSRLIICSMCAFHKSISVSLLLASSTMPCHAMPVCRRQRRKIRTILCKRKLETNGNIRHSASNPNAVPHRSL